jgi:integrase
MRAMRLDSTIIFPKPGSAGSGVEPPRALSRSCDGLAGCVTVHGFRSTVRTWIAEQTSVPHKVAEAVLSHGKARDKLA